MPSLLMQAAQSAAQADGLISDSGDGANEAAQAMSGMGNMGNQSRHGSNAVTHVPVTQAVHGTLVYTRH